MQQITEANFESEIKNGVVIVDFFANWCGPCRYLAPILEQIQGAKVVKVDVDQDQNLAERFRVSGIPKLIFFKDGVEVFEMLGLQSREAIQEKVNRFNA
jgi:thioredoxin 1